jgi:hypothetical protein
MALKLEFAPLSTPPKGVLVVFCDEGLKFGLRPAKSLRDRRSCDAGGAAGASRATGRDPRHRRPDRARSRAWWWSGSARCASQGGTS